MDISTQYMGFQLRNPVIVGSSGLTSTLDGVIGSEKSGAGAVVLKSLFEEQIIDNYKTRMSEFKIDNVYPEAEEYLSHHTKMKSVENYLTLIRNSKKAVSIPVIASVNCVSFSEWTNFAKEMQLAGADAIELNISIYPSDITRSSAQHEEMYIEILNEVVKNVSVPVSLKISPYFSSLAKSALRFSFTGIKGLVLFNRLYSPDIDIDTLEIVPGNIFSSPDEITLPVRWASILSERVSCDIAASTGIHDGKGLVKVLLAGAKAAQICSILYMSGFEEISKMLNFLEDYMENHGYSALDQFIGKMSMRNTDNPPALDRVQFMQHFIDVK